MFRSVGLKKKLVLLFLVFGLAPAALLSALSLRTAATMEESTADRFLVTAENIADKIDRNLYERYGDVQAFGLNRVVHDRAQWYKTAEKDNSIVKTMNAYVKTYSIYYLTMLVDPQGKLIAVNTRDSLGQPINSAPLYKQDFSQTPWFRACAAGAFTTKMPFTGPGNDISTGTYIEDLHVDPSVKIAYPSDDALAMGFAAAVQDDDGKVVAYWCNQAKFGVVEEIVSAAYRSLKASGAAGAEITVLDSAGRVLVDYDPTRTGSEEVVHDLDKVIMKLNLAEKGVAAAQAAVAGKSGSGWAVHERKQITQASGYTHLRGALGYPGMNWSVLVRTPQAEVAAMTGTDVIERNALAVSVASFFIILVAGLYLGGRFSLPIKLASDRLSSVVNQVSGAAEQVAHSSQMLAEGTSEQASALEETSASLEELSSMTDRNAGNASQAHSMSESTQSAAEKGKAAMARMASAISEIKASSDKTAPIVKTIEEIAFQTNLLALNAAVEAARAGDSGKGFAVVADEVRTLARRSAEAAKNTAALIQESQSNADRGVLVASEVGKVLDQIAGNVQGLSSLIGDVAGANREQSQGIGQVSQAISQIEQVIQSNAASSEQAAAASQQLSAQSIDMGELVNCLRDIVDGCHTAERSSPVDQPTTTPSEPVDRIAQFQSSRPQPRAWVALAAHGAALGVREPRTTRGRSNGSATGNRPPRSQGQSAGDNKDPQAS